MEATNETIQQPLCEAIMHGETIQLDYQGNHRHVIPLVFGLLKNGKEALLCYKLDEEADGGQVQSIRLYHSNKIANVHVTGKTVPHSKRIDYYLTRHFRRVYMQV